jgi:FMN phosphatase YigB (HAD superfamily)
MLIDYIAFKQESRQNPNYGKDTGLNAEKWWKNIIVNTFSPLVGPDQKLPSDLVPKLLHRFWSDEGYTLFPDVLPLIRRIRTAHKAEGTHVVIGVITNSDDRVPDILTSLGMRVSRLRYPGVERFESSEEYDIDFSVMSYDVGHEKPDRRIFEAAEEMLGTAIGEKKVDVGKWRKVYIGDEYAKDVVGAVDAGWSAVLVDREGGGEQTGVKWLDQEPEGSLFEMFKTEQAVGIQSLERLAAWLPIGT